VYDWAAKHAVAFCIIGTVHLLDPFWRRYSCVSLAFVLSQETKFDVNMLEAIGGGDKT
jgi:hypothetical protein